jgi:two-component system, cell cycle response regulator
MRILIADDEAIVRHLLQKTLERAGYEVIAVENGRQAADQLCKLDGPRLALLDWVMPELDAPGDYLTKPFDASELKARLRTGLRILDLEDRLVEAREEMRFKASHDTLTTLWNRRAILELLGRELSRSHRENATTVILLCDIDHFKGVNDSFGHLVGDEVLRETAKRLLAPVRSYDFVGRYGGEEFLLY